VVVLTAGFPRVFPEKRLELKSLKGRTKAEEEGTPFPSSSAFVLPLRLFRSSRFSRKTGGKPAVENTIQI